MVVLAHIGERLKLLVGGDTNPLASGVDIFFIISGFVMIISTDGRNTTPSKFLKARFVRIIPLYWICTGIFLFLIILGVIPSAFPRWDEILKSLLFVFYNNSTNGQPVPILGVGWTLNYEMYFYFLFAATLYLKRNAQIIVLAVWFLAMAALRSHFGNDNGFGLRITSPLPLEFIGGMVLAAFRHRLEAVGGLTLAIALTLVGLSILALNPALPRTVAFGLPAALFIGAGIMVENYLTHPVLKPAKAIGDISYSLYLTHPLVMLSLIGLISTMHPLMAGGIAFISCITLAIVCHKWVEKPLGNLLKTPKPYATPPANAQLVLED